MTENPDLVSTVAASISDGLAVEWERIAEQFAGEDDDLLAELKIVEQIARFHQTGLPGAPDASSIYVRPAHRSQPKIWAHLLILGRIESGPAGELYLAHDTKLRCDVALKLMPEGRYPAGDAARALKEAQHLTRIRHTNLVTVFGAAEASGRVGLWMEPVRGITLDEALKQHGTFGPRDAAHIGLDVCRAVAAVHREGIVHGDITARNVMRDESGRTVLMDCAGRMFGGLPRTRSDDIYGIGALLFHLVTNRYPVEGRTYLRALRPDLPDDFASIVERALDADPRRRFPGAGAFEVSLAGLVGAVAEQGSRHPGRMLSTAVKRIAARLRRGGP